MWGAVAVFRVLALVYALGVATADHDDYTRPWLAYTLLAVMAAWTAVTARARPRRGMLGVDLALAAGLVLATLAVLSQARIDTGAATLPGPWAAAAVLAWAVAGGPWWGLAAGAVVAAADVIERGALTQTTVYGIVLLLIAGGVGGYVVRMSQRAADAGARVARLEAATAERERLARDIHDSVLQVLALVARRGSALGGEAAELGRLAGEQEVALRTLVTAPLPVVQSDGEIDVRAMLEPLARDRVTVSCPATPVLLAEAGAAELVAATKAALDNVGHHAGPAARAWVLLEGDDETVTVSVRDDGLGMTPDRLAAARREGRLGVEQSILGRMRSIGGDATIESAPGAGTEVELRVPRR